MTPTLTEAGAVRGGTLFGDTGHQPCPGGQGAFWKTSNITGYPIYLVSFRPLREASAMKPGPILYTR